VFLLFQREANIGLTVLFRHGHACHRGARVPQRRRSHGLNLCCSHTDTESESKVDFLRSEEEKLNEGF
jgi:hypothetical protein